MGLYFRKRVKILPGVHLNISKTGTSWTVGPRGASVNAGKRGAYVNTGIPGTGIYSRTKISGNKSSYSSKCEKDNEIINKNPLRFILIFLFFWASIMIPLLTNASWIWFPILAVIGICCAFIPDKKVEENNKIKNENEIETVINTDLNDYTESSFEDENSGIEDKLITEKNSLYKEINDIKTFDLNLLDPLFEESARLIVNTQQGSTSLIQRKFAIGYNRAGRIIEQLEKAGIVGSSNGARPREVLCTDAEELEKKLQRLTEEMFKNTNEEKAEFKLQDEYEQKSRLISIGIDLEREGMIDEAIKVYEKSIISKLPMKHPYERLAILYRKKKDYENEIRVIKTAIEVFMKENERRANRVTDEDGSMYKQVMLALETNESIKYEDGKWAFVQYDVMNYITRLEKAKKMLEKSKTNNL